MREWQNAFLLFEMNMEEIASEDDTLSEFIALKQAQANLDAAFDWWRIETDRFEEKT